MEQRNRIVIIIALIIGALLENGLRHGVLFHSNVGKWDTGNWELTGPGSTRGIADERWTYYFDKFFLVEGEPKPAMDIYTEVGKYLAPYFEGLPFTVAIPGGANMRAYYANFRSSINEYGLTDSAIAHTSIAERARIGHEKQATDAYLTTRHADFELGGVIANLPSPLPVESIAFKIPTIGMWQLARVITYDRKKMNALARRLRADGNESVLPIYEGIIPYYIQNVLPNAPLDEIERDYAEFQRLYLDKNPTPAYTAAFQERIKELRSGLH